MLVQEEEENGRALKREAWFQSMHRAAPGLDWRQVELANQYERLNTLRSVAQSRDGMETLANGQLNGTWYELGSNNQAGSVVATDYRQDLDEIWLISAGGTLFKGPRDGSDWQVVQEKVRFSGHFLKWIDTPNGKRLLAAIERVPHYSDDAGKTWTPSTGITYADGWGNFNDAIVLDDSLQTIYMLAKPDYYGNISIYKSTDRGETYQNIKTFNGYNNFGIITLFCPHNTQEVYLAEKFMATTRIYQLDLQTNALSLVNSNPVFKFGDNGRANIAATKVDDIYYFYAYNSKKEVWRSLDRGKIWEQVGQLEEDPWDVGIYVSPSNPQRLLVGAVECFRSLDGGQNWKKINGWGEYYGNIDKLHADMMWFAEYKTSDNKNFVLVSNHGGLHVTYNNFFSFINIGKLQLNVSQYYDVVTHPQDPYFVFAGAQDQGFQRGPLGDATAPANFVQVISGDYGHIVFSEPNKMWMVYPGGWVSYYADAKNGGIVDNYTVESTDESVWIPPLCPVPNQNAVFLAGGNKDGGNGSRLIRLTYNGFMDVTQSVTDFKTESNGVASAIAVSPFNPDLVYVATNNGRFFISQDGGLQFDQALSFIPDAQYLYGNCIYPSRIDPDKVYVAGSGYSGPGVLVSKNGGQTFGPFGQNIPSTLFYEITATADESMFFAATEAGPYVYLAADDSWYPMAGSSAPAQTYWSVEYLEDEQRVRFGTYGRGIWDFQIQSATAAGEEAFTRATLEVLGNPVQDQIRFRLNDAGLSELTSTLYDLGGRIRDSRKFVGMQTNQVFSIPADALEPGMYVLTVRGKEKTHSCKIIRL